MTNVPGIASPSEFLQNAAPAADNSGIAWDEDERMLKSFLLAGVFLTISNLLSPIAPTVHATTAAMTSPTVPQGKQTLADATSGIQMTPAESEFVTLINSERTSRGENALTVDPLLVATARAHSKEMCELNYFDHHSPTAGLATPLDRYMKGLHNTCSPTPSYVLIGENIYYCSVFNSHYNVEYAHEALMHSPGHRANILEPRFTKVGIGIYQDASGQFWVTEMFLKDTP
jgi:uncharacterized protein YkwD